MMRKRFWASAIALVGSRRRGRGRSRLRSSAVTLPNAAARSGGGGSPRHAAAAACRRRAAPPAPAPSLPVLAAQPSHPSPDRADLLLGANERGERFLGTAGLTLGMEPARHHVGQALPQIGQPAVQRSAGDDLL